MMPLERLQARTFVDPDTGCWISSLGVCTAGYSQVWNGSRLVMAHVLGWEALHGPKPEGFEIDHLCRRKPCWNPEHLELVTHAENVRRAQIHKEKPTHCPAGHEYTEANMLVRGGVRRLECAECNRVACRERARRRRAMSQ